MHTLTHPPNVLHHPLASVAVSWYSSCCHSAGNLNFLFLICNILFLMSEVLPFPRCMIMLICPIGTWCTFSLRVTSVFPHFKNQFFLQIGIFAFFILHSLSVKNPITNVSKRLILLAVQRPFQNGLTFSTCGLLKINSNSLFFFDYIYSVQPIH